MNCLRVASSGSGISRAATCGFCTSRSLSSDSLLAIRQNAMFTRLMYGFCAQAINRTRRDASPRASMFKSADGIRC